MKQKITLSDELKNAKIKLPRSECYVLDRHDCEMKNIVGAGKIEKEGENLFIDINFLDKYKHIEDALILYEKNKLENPVEFDIGGKATIKENKIIGFELLEVSMVSKNL